MRIPFKSLALAALLATPAVRAADKDDFYLEGQAGVRWETERLFQYGFSGGYCPWNEIGLGAFVDLSQRGLRTQYGLEFRWFFEPFEIDFRAGLLQKYDEVTKITENRFLAAAGLSYLVALSSSLAIKAEVRYHGFVADRSTLFSGAGGRLLF